MFDAPCERDPSVKARASKAKSRIVREELSSGPASLMEGLRSNQRFQPTPQRCALGFPRSLRSLGAAEPRRYMHESLMFMSPGGTRAAGSMSRSFSVVGCGNEQLGLKPRAYNKRFQPTPPRCARGFPRPLRGLGAAEPRR
jgi:hypothetical protein